MLINKRSPGRAEVVDFKVCYVYLRHCDIKEGHVGYMATATVPVVVWSHDKKDLMSCSVSVDTTFQDVITSLGLHNIQSALVGHTNLPFKLMAGDFAPTDDYDPEDVPTWGADTFTGKVVDIVFWMEYVGDGPIAEGKRVLGRKEEIQAILAEVLAGHEIHLFMYDHRQDCCFTKSPAGAFTERDPATTTEASSLWLRLEKKFIEEYDGQRGTFDGWAHTHPGFSHAATNEKSADLLQMRALVEAL